MRTASRGVEGGAPSPSAFENVRLPMSDFEGRTQTDFSAKLAWALDPNQGLVCGGAGAERGGGEPSRGELVDTWARMLYESYCGKRRLYHTVPHIFKVTEGTSPLQMLGGLFHDVVYFQPDGALTQSQWELVNHPTRAVDVAADGKIFVGEAARAVEAQDDAGEGEGPEGAKAGEGRPASSRRSESPDPLLSLCAGIFGLSAGAELSVGSGQNEFLSAVISARCLALVLPLSVVAQVVTIIEATIPFRPQAFPAQLHERLVRSAERTPGCDLSAAAAKHAVCEAISLANRDVADFASEDSAAFLANTWLLLPEGNWELWKPATYSTSCWRKAIAKVHAFYTRYIQPVNVFHSFAAEPNADDMALLLKRSRVNIEVARAYLGVKLLAAGVLEALAIASGGDMPVSGLMGPLAAASDHGDWESEPQDLRAAKRTQRATRMEDNLPQPASHADGSTSGEPSLLEGLSRDGDLSEAEMSAVVDVELHRLVYEGRKLESSFDLSRSPLAAYLLWAMGKSGTQDALAKLLEAWGAPTGEVRGGASGALKLLKEVLPRDVACAVVRACSMAAQERQGALKKLSEALQRGTPAP